MDDMWTVHGRVKPVVLDFDSVTGGSFVKPPLRNATAPPPAPSANGHAASTVNGSANGVEPAGLRDQRELTTKENLELFIDRSADTYGDDDLTCSCKRLSARAIAHADVPLTFDKDDDDTLDFVLATANLRATAYGIANKTRFQVKGEPTAYWQTLTYKQKWQATSSPPSLPQTPSSPVSSLPKHFTSCPTTCQQLATYFWRLLKPIRPLNPYHPAPPDKSCPVCRDVYIPFKVDLARTTLGTFVRDVIGSWLLPGLADSTSGVESEWSILEGTRVLADPDFDDNYDRTLEDLNVQRGKMITILDEDERFRAIHFCICEPYVHAKDCC